MYNSRYSENYFSGAFQAMYTRTRSRHSKEFIHLKSLKIICEEVNLSWIREIPVSLQKKIFHIFFFIYFAFIFKGRITIPLSEEALTMCEQSFFQEI